MRYSDQIAADQCGRYKEIILYCTTGMHELSLPEATILITFL